MTAAVQVELDVRRRAYEKAADQVAAAAVNLIAYESAARLAGTGVNSAVQWAALRVPRTVGEPITTGTMAAAIAVETAKQHTLLNR